MMKRRASWMKYALAVVVVALLGVGAAALPLLMLWQISAEIPWNQPLAERVVAEVSKGTLKLDANGEVVLPARYAFVSKNGRVYVTHRIRGLIEILFPLWIGK